VDVELTAALAIALATEITGPIGQQSSKAIDVTWW
jgi:hypothetical protein